MLGPFLAAMLAATYTEVGEYDKATDRLEYLLTIPGDLSVNLLEVDPAWDPLREHPEVQRLLETY